MTQLKESEGMFKKIPLNTGFLALAIHIIAILALILGGTLDAMNPSYGESGAGVFVAVIYIVVLTLWTVPSFLIGSILSLVIKIFNKSAAFVSVFLNISLLVWSLSALYPVIYVINLFTP